VSTGPQRLGKYELRERLGQGGIGEVWKALDPQLQRYFAIKILQVDLQEDPEFKARFNRVARAVASLQHRNIVSVHDFQVHPAAEPNKVTLYIVMDYVEGSTLGEYIRETSSAGNIPAPSTIVQLFASISAGIDYAHQHNISHRDIKPTNILLDKHNTARNIMGEPMFTDLSLIELMTASTHEINAKLLNPLYISPEQAQGLPGTTRSDIYSLGVILYEVCTGMHPYKGNTPPDILMQHIGATPTPPALYHKNIPPAVAMTILRSLTKDPNARYPSASSMTAALAEALNLPTPEISSISEYTIDPRNSPTYIMGKPIEGIRFDEKRQESDAISSGTPLPGNQAALYRSNPIEVVTPPGTTPPVIPAASATPAFATAANTGQNTPMTPTVTGSVGSSSGSPYHVNATPNLSAMTSAPTTPLPSSMLPTGPTLITPPPGPKRRSKGLLIASVAALMIVLLGAGLGTFYAIHRNNVPAVTANPIVGHAYFLSSGLSNETSAQGINDEFQIDLQNVHSPAAGKSYYAWLLGDSNNSVAGPLYLTKLNVNQGKVHYVYPGDRQHDNLLASYSSLLITEEDTNNPPITPSLDSSTWRYIAALPQKPNPADTVNHYSVLSHLRHLLSGDPTLDGLGLHGGLGIWLVRNVEKVQAWAGSARDYWATKDAVLMRNQLIRILDYLDSATYVGQDVQLANPVIVGLAQVALLELDQNQAPPGYLLHITRHLRGISGDPEATSDQRNLASKITSDLDIVTQLLTQVRNDAKQLVNLPDAQLLTQNSLSILNDMASQALYAYAGQLDPATNNVQDGVIEVYYHLASLASFEITQYKL
jgi:eukaryotic-like serine/threonine-protein kinase